MRPPPPLFWPEGIFKGEEGGEYFEAPAAGIYTHMPVGA